MWLVDFSFISNMVSSARHSLFFLACVQRGNFDNSTFSGRILIQSSIFLIRSGAFPDFPTLFQLLFWCFHYFWLNCWFLKTQFHSNSARARVILGRRPPQRYPIKIVIFYFARKTQQLCENKFYISLLLFCLMVLLFGFYWSILTVLILKKTSLGM